MRKQMRTPPLTPREQRARPRAVPRTGRQKHTTDKIHDQPDEGRKNKSGDEPRDHRACELRKKMAVGEFQTQAPATRAAGEGRRRKRGVGRTTGRGTPRSILDGQAILVEQSPQPALNGWAAMRAIFFKPKKMVHAFAPDQSCAGIHSVRVFHSSVSGAPLGIS